MRRIASTIALLAASSVASQVVAGTHCVSPEQSLWSCTSKGKLYELCASHDLTKDRGYLQYRAGRIGSVELVFPTSKLHPRGLFKHQLYARNAALIFRNGDFEYELFDALTGKSELRVYRTSGKLLADISCNESNETFVGTDIIRRFAEIGLRE